MDTTAQSSPLDSQAERKKTSIVIPSLMIILLVTKFLGFVKIRVIAELFGGTRELDIFWAAFALPDTLFNVLVVGSINAAIIPIFSTILHKEGDEKLAKFLVQLNTILTILLLLFSVILFIFSPQISNFLIHSGQVGTFLEISQSLTDSDVQLLSQLMRIMTLSPILLGISSLLTGYLQVYKKFVVTTIAPLLYNIGMIIGSLVLVRYVGMGVNGFAWAVIIGTVLHLGIQIPGTVKLLRLTLADPARTPIFRIKDFRSELKKIFTLSVPRALSLFGDQVIVIFNTIVGLGLTSGALSAYKYAYSLHLFPAQIISGSISTVSLPKFSEFYVKKDIVGFKELFNKSIQESVFLILPFVAIMIILRMPVVRLALGGGNFSWDNTVFTAWSLALLSFDMLAQVVAAITLRAFYAVHETKLPLITTALTVLVNIVCTYFFVNFFSHYSDWRPIIDQIFTQLSNGEFSQVISSFGSDLVRWFTTRNMYDYAIGGIALSLTVAYLFEAFMNMVLLNRKIHVVTWKDTVKPMLVKVWITVLTMIVMYLFYRWSDSMLDTSRTINVIIVFVTSSIAGVLVYVSVSWYLQVKELFTVTDKIKMLILRFKK